MTTIKTSEGTVLPLSSPISGWAPRWWLQTPSSCPPPPGSSGRSSRPAPPEPGAPPSPRPWRPRSQPAGGSARPGGSRDHGERRREAAGSREKCCLLLMNAFRLQKLSSFSSTNKYDFILSVLVLSLTLQAGANPESTQIPFWLSKAVQRKKRWSLEAAE